MSERPYLPDTNVFSAYAARHNPRLVARVEREKSRLLVSTVVLAEMQYGWQSAPAETHRIRRQKEFVTGYPALPFDEDGAIFYGAIKTHLRHRLPNAQPIGERDLLLAAHAMALGAVLVTHNLREFTRVPGLVVEDWETAA
jgi:tRNA(fMet)-specific endonuclease VapC